jgi:hypothetical protein
MVGLRVVLEVAPKRSFASAIDWPGWSRGGRTPDEAIERLVVYAQRYAGVARLAREPFGARSVAATDVEIVERLTGGGGTEFGVPGVAADIEAIPPTSEELRRLTRLLHAAWRTFDRAAEEAASTTLRVGPRGGGRQVAKIIEHVTAAESAYLHQLGARPPSQSLEALRAAFEAAASARVAGEPIDNPSRVKRPWAVRYAIRRSAWHALDHAWEIEDRRP